MKVEHKKLLKQIEELFDSKFEKVFEGAREGFAYYFSQFDIEGVKAMLNDYNNYDGVSKDYYIRLINDSFNKLKIKGVKSLEVFPGVCNECVKGCKGFTFLDDELGVYVDIIVEVKDKEITNFMECYDLINSYDNLNKKERIVIKSHTK